jgi:hypothetical protein
VQLASWTIFSSPCMAEDVADDALAIFDSSEQTQGS